MDKKAATALATKLHEQLGSKALRVQPYQLNPHTGDASLGWVAQVVLADGEEHGVMGNDASGYNLTNRTLGWMSFDRLLATLVGDLKPADEEPEQVEELSLVERLTAVSAALVELGRELAAIRDELAMRQ